MVNIQDVIERFTFYNEETGYAVAKLSKGATVVGNLPGVNVGETVKFIGEWITHPKYGRQFKVYSFETIYPITVSGIQKYLGSGLIKGIGPVMSERIVNKFKENTLYIIENEVSRVSEVDGIGYKRVEMIKNGWEEQKAIKDVMLFLQSHNISTTYAIKIYKTYKDDSITIVQENPYQLTYDIWGIGFKTADKIAESMGIKHNDYRRVRAGIVYVLNEGTNDGHAYLPIENLLKDCRRLLQIELESTHPVFKDLISEELIIRKKEKIYLPSLYYAERGIENRINLHISITKKIDRDQFKNLRLKERYYSDEQLDAIRKSLTEKMLIITGGPGTGKTTTLKGIINCYKQLRCNIMLAAPTGRAAKRMSEVIGMEAKTIHRMLEFKPKNMKFRYNENNQLKTHLLVIDEVSMMDTILMNNLLKAVASNTTVIFVGDVDQLPSVGPGNVLKDLINSGKISVIALTIIFRQAEQSRIVVNAHKINKGEFPNIKNQSDSDFFFIEKDNVNEIQQLILDLTRTRLPKKYKFNTMKDIQILTPMYRGETGALQLNDLLQAELNKNTIQLTRGGRKFIVGDKVMQLRNNYFKEVFNGDLGFIHSIDYEEQILRIDFDGRLVKFDFLDLSEITLAYAISVHKSQGSEYPCVIMPLSTQHYMMLQRNLLYTALTRAKNLMIVIGTKKAIAITIKNDKVHKRFTSVFITN